MAIKKISELNGLVSIDDEDFLPIVDNSTTETKKVIASNLKTYIEGTLPTRMSTAETNIGTIANLETTATDLVGGINEVKGQADKLENVTKYLTAVAGSNSDCKINITNTLATGMEFHILYPTPTDGTQNARFSINNGVTYYNIQFNGEILKGNILSGKYLTLIYNGSIFEVLGFKASITAVISGNTNSTNTNPVKLPLVLKSRFGTKFSMSNGGILIPAGVSKVRISAQVYVATIGGSSTKKGLVYQDGASLAMDGLQLVNANYWAISLTPLTIDVTPGSILYLYAQGVNNDVWEGNGSAQYNRLVVEEV